MSIWDRITGQASAQFLDVIEWSEQNNQTILFKFPIHDQAITDGSKLTVRPGQSAVFVHEGQMSGVFDEGMHELNTNNAPITSFFNTIAYGFNNPYKGDIFFVSRRTFSDQKWGTPGAIPMTDPQFGMVNLRAFGSFEYRVTRPDVLLRELVGNLGLYTTEDINGTLKRKLASAFVDAVAEAEIPFLKLARQYNELGEALVESMSQKFQDKYGIAITDFIVERISLPPEVEKMMNKVTSMNMVGDMNRFTQFQSANAIESAANNPGGGNSMMNAGVGLAMGQMMGNAMGQGMTQSPSATPPPAPTSTVHYNGSAGEGQFSAQEIANKIAANQNGTHNIWANGWPGWKSWKEVPEIASLVQVAPPPPPASGEDVVFHYNGPEGQSQLPASQIAAKVKSSPEANHLVWKEGFDNWKPASEVAEIQAKLNAGGPPPLPGAGGPPPIP
ncbi:MAG: SPFH domain-containing protein [Myxococcota bacterium]|nr:SPFH domain-containing protein [Myxococcota bacterium]